ncbi:MAG: pseudouridine synthase [Lachnospiraceae bacterium]|jgi:pseudouridine synthase|nr:pseudouridine synthase [Lachnospiraceae bacterium]
MTRLNKYLAECGVCSRRDADKLIETGAVEVNHQIARFGVQVKEQDIVTVNGKIVRPASAKVVLAYYKPAGVTCTERDKYAQKTIVDALQYPVRLTYAGRLDKESEGLMIMTNDGDLIQYMMKGSQCHEKEYIVKVDKEITDIFIKRMSGGVYLPELEQTTRKCTVEPLGKYTFRIILTQGLNRQIRRMCAVFGYQIRSLIRVRVLNITLDGLKRGDYREIVGAEREKLYQICGL